jgi:hypothetical protein
MTIMGCFGVIGAIALLLLHDKLSKKPSKEVNDGEVIKWVYLQKFSTFIRVCYIIITFIIATGTLDGQHNNNSSRKAVCPILDSHRTKAFSCRILNVRCQRLLGLVDQKAF